MSRENRLPLHRHKAVTHNEILKAMVNRYTLSRLSFVIKNNGAENLIICKVEASCPCVKIHQVPDSILPTGQASISGMIGLSESDKALSKAIFLTYNDMRVVLLKVKGIVKP